MITGGIVDSSGEPVELFGAHWCFVQTVPALESLMGIAIVTLEALTATLI